MVGAKADGDQLLGRWVEFLMLMVSTHIMQAMVAMAMAEEAMGEVETWEEVE